MDVTSDGKWFWVEPPSVPTSAAAERILALRMEEVERYLPLAARHDADDVEYVHQLRVSCRRAAAALRAFKPLEPRGRRRLKDWLQRLRRAAGPARDADVFAARLRAELDPANPYAQQLVAVVGESRAEAQKALEDADRKAGRGGLKRAIEKCLRGLRESEAPEAEVAFAEFARNAVGDAAEKIESIDAHEASFAELHQLRIAGKRLRYSIEIFHSAAEPALRLEAYPQVEEIQERLGNLNDRAGSQLRLQQWLARLPADGLAAFAANLIVGEHAAVERFRSEFLAWWTPHRQTDLRELLVGAFG
jgi:CHAD domain-containing protein